MSLEEDIYSTLRSGGWQSPLEIVEAVRVIRFGRRIRNPSWFARRFPNIAEHFDEPAIAAVHVYLGMFEDRRWASKRPRLLDAERLAARNGKGEFEYSMTLSGQRRQEYQEPERIRHRQLRRPGNIP